jgi:hypothetical protein
MAINYLEGKIDSVRQPILHEALRIRDMDELSEGYCAATAVWFDLSTLIMIDTAEICYAEGKISPLADPEQWFRVLRLPDGLGYVIDGSHMDEVQDDDGKFITPLPVYNGLPYEGAEAVEANDYIRNPMQLDGAAHIMRDLYGYELGKSALHSISETFNDDSSPD